MVRARRRSARLHLLVLLKRISVPTAPSLLFDPGLAPYRFGLFRSTPAAGSRQVGDPPKDGLVPLAGLDDLGLGSQEKIRIGIERLSIRGTGPLPL